MRPLRFLAIVAYMGYLVNVGLLMVVLPWSRAWGRLLTMLPLDSAVLFDQPWFRGAISAFGVLHLLLVTWELLNPTLLMSDSASQDSAQS